DLSGLGGGAAVVFASGFLSPMDNQNGEAFGLFAALPDGTVLNLNSVTSVSRMDAPLPVRALQVYPNPARDQSTLRFSVQNDATVQLRLYDLSGRVVYSAERSMLIPGEYDAVIPTASLAPGMYRLIVSTGDATASTNLSVIR
ncbi:MAG: T9SS type A sorting domain-containing protein, partial [Bacteroidetes bacterium]|nr:T9SS type A sorting domain-containing protein [Bacteroidota bacterium]